MVFTQNQKDDIENIATTAIKAYVNEKDKLFIKELAKEVAVIVTKELDKRFNDLMENNIQLTQRIINLEKENGQLNKKLDQQEQYSRRNNIRIFGLPEKKEENTDELALKVFKENMGLEITEDLIDRTHRVGFYNPTSKKPCGIIIKFTSYRYRNLIFKNKRKLKGSQIIIKEDLTHNRVKVLNYASDKFGYKNVWSGDGVIFVNKNNKKHPCQTMDDVNKLCD